MEWRDVVDVVDIVDIVDAARRLESRWSLLNVRTAVGGTAAAAVKILIRRIGERGSNILPTITLNNGLHWSLLQPSTGRPLETLYH